METYRGVLGAIEALAIFGGGFICGAYVVAKAVVGAAKAVSFYSPMDSVTYEVD